MKMGEAICRRLRFSTEATEQIVALIANHMKFANVQAMKESTLKKFLRMPRFEEHLELHRLDCQSSHGDLSAYQFSREKLENMPQEMMRPRPLINGDDLIAAGYSPGPQFKRILSAVEDLQLEGTLASHDQAMEYVRQQFVPAH